MKEGRPFESDVAWVPFHCRNHGVGRAGNYRPSAADAQRFGDAHLDATLWLLEQELLVLADVFLAVLEILEGLPSKRAPACG